MMKFYGVKQHYEGYVGILTCATNACTRIVYVKHPTGCRQCTLRLFFGETRTQTSPCNHWRWTCVDHSIPITPCTDCGGTGYSWVHHAKGGHVIRCTACNIFKSDLDARVAVKTGSVPSFAPPNPPMWTMEKSRYAEPAYRQPHIQTSVAELAMETARLLEVKKAEAFQFSKPVFFGEIAKPRETPITSRKGPFTQDTDAHFLDQLTNGRERAMTLKKAAYDLLGQLNGMYFGDHSVEDQRRLDSRRSNLLKALSDLEPKKEGKVSGEPVVPKYEKSVLTRGRYLIDFCKDKGETLRGIVVVDGVSFLASAVRVDHAGEPVDDPLDTMKRFLKNMHPRSGDVRTHAIKIDGFEGEYVVFMVGGWGHVRF